MVSTENEAARAHTCIPGQLLNAAATRVSGSCVSLSPAHFEHQRFELSEFMSVTREMLANPQGVKCLYHAQWNYRNALHFLAFKEGLEMEQSQQHHDKRMLPNWKQSYHKIGNAAIGQKCDSILKQVSLFSLSCPY